MNETFLGFDWNAVLFFVVLLITLGIAYALRRFPILWLLPAIVLYKGLNWGFPFDDLYKFIFVIMVIVACLIGLVAGLLQNRWGGRRGKSVPMIPLIPFYMMIVMLFLLIGVLIFSGDWHVSEEDAKSVVSETVDDVTDEEEEGFESDLNPDPTNEPEPTTSPTTGPEATETVSPTPSPTSSPSPQGNGDDEEGEDVRRYDGQMPSVPSGTCHIVGWDSLVECVEEHDLHWYVEGVNSRSEHTGFDWSDVQQWAEARLEDGRFPEVRYVQVFGNRVSDDQAIDWANDQVDRDLRVVRQSNCFDNTEGIPGGQLRDFRYCPLPDRQMRISLMPLQLDEDGDVVDVLNTQSGVFVDCLNVWWSVRYGE